MLVNKRGVAELQALSEALDLPLWLLESLIVEYLPCRRVDEIGPAIVIDYALASQEQVKAVTKPIVLLNAPLLMHNVTADTARYRLFLGTAAILGARVFPVATLAEHPSMSIPNGKVSPHHLRFPHQEDQPDTDEKVGLNIFGYCLVIDEDGLYQWQIAQDAHSLATYRSDILSAAQVNDLERISAELNECAFIPESEAARTHRQSQIETLYKELEQVRSTMRDAVLAHHQAHKTSPDALLGYTKQKPPELTAVDQFTIRQGAIKVRTFVEPLFFRAAHRAAMRAAAARDLVVSGTLVSIYIAEEIEAAAEAITRSAMCLEAYINGFAHDHLTQLGNLLPELLRKLEIKTKWCLFPSLLGHPDCFAKDRAPYQGFSDLVYWRNEVLVHYKHEFSPPEPLARRNQMATRVHHVCNADNAQRAIQTVIDMVRRITTCCGMEPPDWVQDSVLNGGWLRAEDLAAVERRPRPSDEITLPKLNIHGHVQTRLENDQDS